MEAEATITSKGQITIPSSVRKEYGLRAGDKIRFKSLKTGIKITPAKRPSAFEKYRGIGTPGIGPGREAVIKAIREMRGHDDFDE